MEPNSISNKQQVKIKSFEFPSYQIPKKKKHLSKKDSNSKSLYSSSSLPTVKTENAKKNVPLKSHSKKSENQSIDISLISSSLEFSSQSQEKNQYFINNYIRKGSYNETSFNKLTLKDSFKEIANPNILSNKKLPKKRNSFTSNLVFKRPTYMKMQFSKFLEKDNSLENSIQVTTSFFNDLFIRAKKKKIMKSVIEGGKNDNKKLVLAWIPQPRSFND